MYYTKNTCARRIRVKLEGDIVKQVEFLDGGCSGNLQAVPRLVEGLTVAEVEERLGGIKCGFRPTSCADQLSIAVREAYESGKSVSD
ncbi:MAG: TIGR03905 family TSCPD domain-containing protein [Lachnospiraceae bacterium]|nr:TIGR03905 family TSCPD domain-containing protein [Lachnospiraceae bacterium]